MKTDINGLWRFYDGANKISGITVGESRDEALDNAMNYIKEFFDDIMKKEPDVYVWRIETDDDYHCNNTIAITY